MDDALVSMDDALASMDDALVSIVSNESSTYCGYVST